MTHPARLSGRLLLTAIATLGLAHGVTLGQETRERFGTIDSPPEMVFEGAGGAPQAGYAPSAGYVFTADITPRDQSGQQTLNDDRPERPSETEFTETVFVQPKGCFGRAHDYCCVLRYARFCHRPLRFEDYRLERCGECRGPCQPVCSAAHFFGSVACLPRDIVRQPCWEYQMTPPLCCRNL